MELQSHVAKGHGLYEGGSNFSWSCKQSLSINTIEQYSFRGVGGGEGGPIGVSSGEDGRSGRANSDMFCSEM